MPNVDDDESSVDSAESSAPSAGSDPDGVAGSGETPDADDDESSVDSDESSTSDAAAPRAPATTRSGRSTLAPQALGPAEGGRYASVARGAVHATDSEWLNLRSIQEMLMISFWNQSKSATKC